MATLYVVSTPIGNLDDLTHRAARVLGEVGRVLAEDTRRTGRLLDHIGVKARLISLHAHNEASRRARVLEWLGEGMDLALVSDAGTPLVSDPGARILQAVLEAGHEVVPIPGASAVLAALVASGLPADKFTFLGFVPRQGPERRAVLARVARAEETVVLFESPERLTGLLRELVSTLGAERRVAVGRELTKLYESVFRGTLSEALVSYEETPARGEVTVVVAAAPLSTGTDESDRARAAEVARELLERGESPSRAAREVAERLGLPRNLAYEIVQEAKDG